MTGDSLDSAAWYDRHTQDYIERTKSADLSHLYAWFLRRVPAGGRILDAGCGPGRDSLAFQRRGYEVVAMDGSIAMVKHASELLQTQAIHMRHQEVEFVAEFDGVWSMASLLHVPHDELPGVLARYRNALVPGGVLFASFKHGDGMDRRDERLFANQNDDSFRRVLAAVPDLVLLGTRIDPDGRPGRQGEEWFSVLCERAIARTGSDRSTETGGTVA